MGWQHTDDGLLIKLHRMARPDYPAVFVQEPGLRDGLNLKLSGQRLVPVQCHSIMHRRARPEALDHSVVLAGDTDDFQPAVVVFFVQVVQVRDARPARRTSRRPELDQHQAAREGRCVAEKLEIPGKRLHVDASG